MNLVHRLRSRWQNRSEPNLQRATARDIYYCYRLFLNREPDQAGYEDWLKLIKNNHISVAYLTDSFLASREFLDFQAKRAEPKLVQLPGFKLYTRLNDYFIGRVIAQQGVYEPHVTAVLHHLLKPGMTFLDVGANIGYFTLLAASIVGENGRVISFEPVPDNVQLLQKSISANAFTNITLHPQAVLEAPQQIALEIGSKNSNSRVVDPENDETERPIVDAVVLDDVLNNLPRLDVVKMDIEGAEPRALQGMKQLLQTHHPTLIAEFSPALIQLTSGVTPINFLQQLEALGYELLALMSNSPLEQAVPQSAAALVALCQQTPEAHLDILARHSSRA